MEIKSLGLSKTGKRVAEVGDNLYIVQVNTMEFVPCEKVAEGYKTLGEPMVAGMMMRTDEEFKTCVGWVKESEIQNAIVK